MTSNGVSHSTLHVAYSLQYIIFMLPFMSVFRMKHLPKTEVIIFFYIPTVSTCCLSPPYCFVANGRKLCLNVILSLYLLALHYVLLVNTMRCLRLVL